ncbi:hypothetical protein [Herbaspirillum seropedicae]|uniref:hypothetical protein n=1 Tax=Herbaspirillum seropedicae TaxID=964 RepID=UPI003FCD862E
MRLSQWLALRCREREFQQFLRVPDEHTATRVVRALCDVESRAEVDTNPAAEKRCHDLIRKPYIAYTTERSTTHV